MRIIKSFYDSNNFVHDFGAKKKKENLIMCMVMKFIFSFFLKNGIIINNKVESLIHAVPPISYNYIYDYPSAAVINQQLTVIH